MGVAAAPRGAFRHPIYLETPRVEMPKSISVDAQGNPDGFTPPALFSPQVAPDGTTRLLVSAPDELIAQAHSALISVLEGPLGVRYLQLIDRRNEKDQREKPRSWVALDVAEDRLVEQLGKSHELAYLDGRAQLWVRGRLGDQVILDELGMLYAYPDDPAFRRALEAIGVNEGTGHTLADRDYLKVEFLAAAD